MGHFFFKYLKKHAMVGYPKATSLLILVLFSKAVLPIHALKFKNKIKVYTWWFTSVFICAITT